MVRIAVVTPSLNAYSETFIRAHIERLPAEVHVLYGGHLPTLADDGMPLVKKYGTVQRIHFRLAQQLRGLPWDGRAKQTAAIERFLRQHRIQAVLAEYGHTGSAMMGVCAQAGIPLIVHFHGVDAYKSDILSQHKQAYTELFELAAAIVVVSRDMYAQLLKLGAPEGKLHYNPYGVDMSRFAGASPGEAAPHFVATGRFVDKKGPLLTLLAFRQVLDILPEARLVMIGDGPLLEASRQLARSMGFAHAVDFRGVQPHSEVAAAMQNARAFVQHSLRPSDGDSEGTPVAVLEASATGLPVISTRHAGIPDVVVEGETGILVEEGDVDGMAQAMIRLAQEPELAAKIGRAGRRRVEEHFTMDKSIGNLWQIIQSAIDNQGQAHAAR
jgi:colanic acid/amylovoran biosynthesis glycosyltransferase